jgi:hypothetical protein
MAVTMEVTMQVSECVRNACNVSIPAAADVSTVVPLLLSCFLHSVGETQEAAGV